MSENYTNMTLLTCWVAWHWTWRIFTRMYITKINFSRCYIARETLEMQPKKAWTGQPIGQRNICPRMCHDPVGHTNNSTITTCADGATEHRGDEGLGVNICCSSSSALCHTRNNDGKSWNSLSYSCIKEIFSRANRSASNALTSRSNKKTAGNKTKMKMEYDSPSDDGDIPSFEREADLHLGRGSCLRRSIRFNSRIVFSWFFFIFLVMKEVVTVTSVRYLRKTL